MEKGFSILPEAELSPQNRPLPAGEGERSERSALGVGGSFTASLFCLVLQQETIPLGS